VGFLFPARDDLPELAAHPNASLRPRLYFDSRDHALAGNESFVAILAGSGARLPGLRNCGAVAETTFIPAQINCTLRQESPENSRSIVFLRPFNFILQRTLLGEQGKNLGVRVGEFIRRHSDINESQFAFRIVKRIAVRNPVTNTRKPFRVLITGATPICDALAAQKGDVALHPARHRATGELAIRLAVALAVQDVRAQRGGIELRGDGRQALIIDGRGHHLAVSAVKPFAQPDVIHMIIFHARREQFWPNSGR